MKRKNNVVVNKISAVGIIYKVTNTETGDCYIGATTKSLNERKSDHFQKAKNNRGSRFQNAIATYGPEAFSFQQIDTASSIDELAQKEKLYIKEFNSVENGYNIDLGGGFKKSVYQYDSSGNLITKFDDLTTAAKAINTTKQNLSKVCLSVNKFYKGYYWSYDLKVPFKPDEDRRFKKVYQFDLNNRLIAIYKSVSHASRITGLSKTAISRVCRGEREQSKGFIWRYNSK